MNFHSLVEQYEPLVKQHRLPIFIGVLGLIFFVYGLISLIGSSHSSNDIVFESDSEASQSARQASRDIVIDVEGAVVKPGVYHLASDARIRDGLIAASGLASNADRDWVEKNINLAAKLTDGAKIYIPRIGETAFSSPNVISVEQESVAGASSQMNINTASMADLDSLPGIGVVTGQKIIDNRPYSSIDELVNKKIVTSKVFEKIKERITAY